MVVSRKDVASAAGVSPAVVSYVLNDGPRPVAPETRKRVLLAVSQLGYRPNRIAASLRQKRTNSLGLIVPDNINPYFAELAREVEIAAFELGYTLLMGNAMEDVQRENTYVHEFLDRRVDGIILIPSSLDIPTIGEITAAATPLVIVDREARSAQGHAQVLSDNASGGELAVRHLLDHGRTRIACIAGEAGMGNAGARVDGWRAALRDHDSARGPLREVPISRFDGRRAAMEILREDPLVDAIFVTSDEQAIGVLRAVRESGRSCPADVAVISFDGTTHAALTTPGLTTVRQPMQAMAQRALELLIDASARSAAPAMPAAPPNEADPPSLDAVDHLPIELITRGSCGCADEFDPHTQTVHDDPEARR
ncbi:MAG: LacI family transcriptional regulator [Microbacterium sp.]|jgi:LacI family transcriptional regulator|nr:LacI family transcriptional regulator [Microbacterium sp.]